MANLMKYIKLNSTAFQMCKNVLAESKYYSKHFTSKTFQAPRKKKRQKMPLYEIYSLKLAPKQDIRPKQKFNYFLVLDFEATCDSPVNLDPQEIIEFPVLKVNSETFNIESTFHSYVKPVIHPVLTSFCIELTGVIPSMMEDSPTFKEVFENFQKWLQNEDILNPDTKFAFATCGDPDFDYLLPLQCSLSGIEVPSYMRQWINVKRSFCDISPYTWPDNLMTMMKMCELEFSGDLHSGIDDAKNVARVMANLADRGLIYDFNGWKKSDV